MWKSKSWESSDEGVRGSPDAGKQKFVGTSEITECSGYKSTDLTGWHRLYQ